MARHTQGNASPVGQRELASSQMLERVRSFANNSDVRYYEGRMRVFRICNRVLATPVATEAVGNAPTTSCSCQL